MTIVLCETGVSDNGVIIRKELPHHSFTIVVTQSSTPPTPPLAGSTELPLPTSKHEGRGQVRGML